MPVTVVVGGQFGSEGKGKVAHFLAREEGSIAAIRVGGINSGHTVIDTAGTPRVFRQLPTACILPNVLCVLPAGSYLHVPTLLHEIELVGLPRDRLIIDPNAMLITDQDIASEQAGTLKLSIGSTASGTGAAVQRRIARFRDTKLAAQAPELAEYVQQTSSVLRELLDRRRRLIVEGTQGFGLSLLHSCDYPFATSRDTTAAACISEAGLSPLDVDRIVLVIRAFPIRVSGSSGPLPNETDWSTISKQSGNTSSIQEFTTVTKKIRRVARFDPAVVRQAIALNSPTHVVLNHMDYVDANGPSSATERFISETADSIGRAIDYCGYGPSNLIARPSKIRSARTR